MDQNAACAHVEAFVDSEVNHPTLGLVYGRRRIGKSTMLEKLVMQRGGFYWEATRGEPAVHLVRLASALGEFLGGFRLSFDDWEQAAAQLVRLGGGSSIPVVIDEVGYVLEADPSVDSVLAAAFGHVRRRQAESRARVILCGSAMALMRTLTAGEAPLRGRAGMELVMQPFGFREVAEQLGAALPPELRAHVYSAIGGVIGYYTDMVDYDLPRSKADFDRWVASRLLSPAATLHHEATTLLAEDPTLSAASPTLLHSILGAIANGSVTAGKIAGRLKRTVSNLDPALKRLIAAGFVIRHEDPVRARRPQYSLGDPLLQFHYAVIEPHVAILRDRDPLETWRGRLSAVFDSRVRGPVFEEMARSWVRRHASVATLGGAPDFVGPSIVVVDGKDREIDVLVAGADDPLISPAERKVRAIGEAKAGETVGFGHLRALERSRDTLGDRAREAKLLLFARGFNKELERKAAGRSDVELVDLERLYGGS